MTVTRRYYRVRVHDGTSTLADFLDPEVATGNLFVATSVRGGTNPYLSAPPEGDGQELDPLTGKTTVGAYTVRVLDVDAESAEGEQVLLDDFEYVDTAALLSAWTFSDTFPVEGSVTPSLSGAVFHDGAKAARIDQQVLKVGSEQYTAGYRRVFGGYTPGARYTVRCRAYVSIRDMRTGIEANGARAELALDGNAMTTFDELVVPCVADENGDIAVMLWIVTAGWGNIRAHSWDSLRVSEGWPAGTTRLVTKELADEVTADWQLLSRQAVVEVSEDAVTWSTQTTGYLNGLRLVDALEWEFTIGDTRRTELQAELFRAMPAPSDDGSVLTTPPLLIGGPLWNGAAYATPTPGGFGGVTDFGPTRVAVIEQVGHSARQLDLNLVGGYFPPYYVNAFKDDEIFAINAYARQFFEYDDTTWAYDSGQESSVYGWFPGLVVQLTRVSDGAVFLTHPLAVATRRRETDNSWWTQGTGPWGTVDNLVEQNVILRVDWDEATMGAPKPAAGEQFDVRIWPARPSERFPVHERGHPVALHTQKLAQAGVPYDSASATSVTAALNAAYGGSVVAECYWTEPQKLSDYAATLQAFFGYGTRLNADGAVEFFGIRYGAPSGGTAAALAHRRDAESVIFELDEDSIVTAVEVEARTFSRRLATQSFEKGPGAEEIPLSTLVFTTDEVLGATDPTATTQTRTERLTLPGRVLVNGVPQKPATTRTGPVLAVSGYAKSIGDWVVNWRAHGLAKSTIHCLPAVTAQPGDRVLVDQPDLPVAVAGMFAQRGAAAVPCLVVQRTETPAGPDLVVVTAPPADLAPPALVGAETPTGTALDDAFTLSRASADPARVAVITLTDHADLLAADVRVRVEYRVAASEPATGDAYGGLWAVGDFPLSLPAVAPESTVWVRLQLVTPTGGFLTGWTTWQSITLGASPVVVPAPSLAYDALVLASTGVPDVTATLTAPAVSVKLAAGPVDGGPPDAATVRAAPADATAPYGATFAALDPGQHVVVGAFAYDADGNESALATLTVARPDDSGTIAIYHNGVLIDPAATAIDFVGDTIASVTSDGAGFVTVMSVECDGGGDPDPGSDDPPTDDLLDVIEGELGSGAVAGMWDQRLNRLTNADGEIWGLDDVRCQRTTGALLVHPGGGQVQVPNVSDLLSGLGKLTVMWWGTTPAQNNNVGVIAALLDCHDGTANGGFLIQKQNGDFYFYLRNGATDASGRIATPPWTDGELIGLAWVFDGAGANNAARLKCYWQRWDQALSDWTAWAPVTLTFSGTIPATLGTPAAGLPLVIGARRSGAGPLQAVCHEVRIKEGVALSQGQIDLEAPDATSQTWELRYSFDGSLANSGSRGATYDGTASSKHVFCSDEYALCHPMQFDAAATAVAGPPGYLDFDDTANTQTVAPFGDRSRISGTQDLSVGVIGHTAHVTSGSRAFTSAADIFAGGSSEALAIVENADLGTTTHTFSARAGGSTANPTTAARAGIASSAPVAVLARRYNDAGDYKLGIWVANDAEVAQVNNALTGPALGWFIVNGTGTSGTQTGLRFSHAMLLRGAANTVIAAAYYDFSVGTHGAS